MPMTNVLGVSGQRSAMQDTWGHLYPEPGSKHRGKVLLVHHDNSTMLLDRHFATLPNSPQEYALVCSLLDMYEWTDGVHEVECTLWFFKSSDDMYLGERIGKVIKPKVKTLYSTAPWYVTQQLEAARNGDSA